jgi:hypothetical protein
MHADELKILILATVAEHAIAAQASRYDRTVCITAVVAARDVIEGISANNQLQNYTEEVLGSLNALRQTYNDPDGQYTNGKGVIGSLFGDVEAVMREAGS